MFSKKETRYRIVDLKQLGQKTVAGHYNNWDFLFRAQVYARQGLRWKWVSIGEVRYSDYPMKRVGPPDRWTEARDHAQPPEESRAYKEAQKDIIRHIRSGSTAIMAEYSIDEAAKLEASFVTGV